jgi:hypothetical protein
LALKLMRSIAAWSDRLSPANTDLRQLSARVQKRQQHLQQIVSAFSTDRAPAMLISSSVALRSYL